MKMTEMFLVQNRETKLFKGAYVGNDVSNVRLADVFISETEAREEAKARGNWECRLLHDCMVEERDEIIASAIRDRGIH